MGKNIVFIDNSDSFIVGSIERNLEGLGYTCSNVDWTVDDIRSNKDAFEDIVVAYIDDYEDIDPNAIVYLRDTCVQNGYRLLMAGHADDIDEIKKNYAFTQVAHEFHRPINANEVADSIGKMMQSDPVLNRKHILVVDDSGTMLNTIQEWLGGKYRVSVVNSAMNAITFLNKNIPDLILLDYEMPGCSGPQLLEMLRAEAGTERIPVIFLTGKDDPESVKRVLALKPAGYLLKTMPKEYIIGQVDEFFEKQKHI